MSTNSNVISFYKKIFADLMEVINDPFSTEEVRENATTSWRLMQASTCQHMVSALNGLQNFNYDLFSFFFKLRISYHLLPERFNEWRKEEGLW